MSQFTTPLKVELIGKNLFKVIEEFEYHVGSYPSHEIIKVSIGTKTDFASVPRIFWPIISPIDRHGKAAVIHDYCYQVGYDTRKECDKIFKEALRVLKVPEWKVFLMYNAVRLFGFRAWNKYRKNERTNLK